MDGSDVDALSDADILERFQKKARLAPSEHPYSELSIYRITDSTVGKLSQDLDEDITEPSEAVVLEVVFQYTAIPAPRVRRVIKRKCDFLIVMDYVHGRQLSTVWHSLSDDHKAKVASTLQDYVHQLRRVDIPRRNVPGPLASDGARTCECSPVFGRVVSSRGPFASYNELASFFEDRRQKVLAGRHADSDPPDIPPFDSSSPLVLTHSDLNPRNVIVGDDGRLWLVDWAWAGSYPEWWEYVAMNAQAENEKRLTGEKDHSWARLASLVCGSYESQENWLKLIGPALSWV